MKKKETLVKTEKQNELAKIDESLNLDIGSMLHQEINKVKSDRLQWFQSAEVQDHKKFKEAIYDQVLLAFEKADDPRDISDVCKGLSNLLCRSPIHFGEGEDIFHMLYRLVEIKKDKRIKENESKQDISDKDYTLSEDYALSSLRFQGIMYCHKKLEEEIKARDLPAALVYIKELERRLVDDIKDWNIDRTILLEATKDYRIAVERAIAQAKEELELRKQLEIETAETNLDEKIEAFYLRQKVFILLLLTFGRLDKPEDILQERIVKFFHRITGGDIKKLRTLLKNPTTCKENDKQSIKLLCDDLNTVRDEFGKLGITDNLQKLISEIEWFIQDLEEIH